MLGTSPATRGGVASVVRVYESAGLLRRWPVTYITTHVDGTALRKLTVACAAWLSYMAWLVRGRKFLLHVHSASGASFWRKLTFILPAIWTGRPVVFHLHGGGFAAFYENDCNLVTKRLLRYALDRCTRIIVLSESWREAIQRISGNRHIQVVFNPVMPLDVSPESSARVPGCLLFLGRLSKQKGIYVLLDAFSALVQEEPRLRLICAGDGDVAEVRRIVAARGLAESVDVPGWIDEARRAQLLLTASIYVLPSFIEGVPMSILEAMSAGLPVVATPVGGIPEIITDGQEGLLVPAGSVDELAGAIRRLVRDPRLQAEMGARGRAKFRERFDASVIVPRIESIYAELGVSPVEAA